MSRKSALQPRLPYLLPYLPPEAELFKPCPTPVASTLNDSPTKDDYGSDSPEWFNSTAANPVFVRPPKIAKLRSPNTTINVNARNSICNETLIEALEAYIGALTQRLADAEKLLLKVKKAKGLI